MKLFSLRRMEVGFWYSVVAAHVSLGLVPKVLNAVDMAFLFDECFRMIDADVMELRDIQHIVGSETVGVDNAVRLDAIPNNSQQSLCLGILDHHCIHLTATLEETEDGHLTGCPSPSLAFSNASEVALIDFDLTCKERSFSRHLLNDDLTQFVEKQNCCVPIYTRQLSSRSRGYTSHKLLK